MAFVYDAALIAYPLYQTSRYLTAAEGSENAQIANRWLTFWLTYSCFKFVENMAANSIPFFYVVEGIVLLSMYSVEHSVIVNRALPKVCGAYINGADKLHHIWSHQTIVTQAQTSWISGIWNHATSFFGKKIQKTD